jgi:hypothetical protein
MEYKDRNKKKGAWDSVSRSQTEGYGNKCYQEEGGGGNK